MKIHGWGALKSGWILRTIFLFIGSGPVITRRQRTKCCTNSSNQRWALTYNGEVSRGRSTCSDIKSFTNIHALCFCVAACLCSVSPGCTYCCMHVGKMISAQNDSTKWHCKIHCNAQPLMLCRNGPISIANSVHSKRVHSPCTQEGPGVSQLGEGLITQRMVKIWLGEAHHLTRTDCSLPTGNGDRDQRELYDRQSAGDLFLSGKRTTWGEWTISLSFQAFRQAGSSKGGGSRSLPCVVDLP